MTLDTLNELNSELALLEFNKCCGSKKWSKKMLSFRPFKSIEKLIQASQLVFKQLGTQDWIEAFSHHPKIGGDIKALESKFKDTKIWAKNEQQGIESANVDEIKLLSELNLEYEKKFGFIFIICATGKSALNMLTELKKRIVNTKDVEIKSASIEQIKITEIRLRKLISIEGSI